MKLLINRALCFSPSRFERDINQYKSNLEKIGQALELMKETVEIERKKKESKGTNIERNNVN